MKGAGRLTGPFSLSGYLGEGKAAGASVLACLGIEFSIEIFDLSRGEPWERDLDTPECWRSQRSSSAVSEFPYCQSFMSDLA